MNKKFKIVSSIALAGMLITGSLGMNSVRAAETAQDNYETNPVAVYRKLVEGKTVVPFVLANRHDVLTVRDVVGSDMFNGKVKTINGVAVASLDEVVGTGDTFTTTDGTEYTIIVYGDVDGNGKINASDALAVQNYSVKLADSDLSDVQKVAADIENAQLEGKSDGAVNSFDALRIKKYSAELETNIINTLPEEEVEEVTSNYSMTLNDGGYINNQNASTSKLAIKLNETLDEDVTLKLVISDKDEKKIEKNIVVPAHTDYIDTLKEVEGEDEVKDLDLSGIADLKDGKITGKLYEGDKEVATFEIVKNTDAPDVTGVKTERVNTKSATLSLEGMGENPITKVKYVVKKASEGEPELTELTNSVDIQNNKLTNATIASDLETNTVYKIYYVVENEYGSQSIDGLKSAVIANDTNVSTETKLDAVNVPDLTDTLSAAPEFTWTKKDDKPHTYIATLYKDGVAIAEKETSDEKVDFSEFMDKAGAYKVSVAVKGNVDGSSQTSESTTSSEVTVSALKAVENLTLQNDDNGNVVLTWSNPNGKDDFKNYSIELYSLDTDGNPNHVSTISPCKNEENKVSVPGISANNTIYVAKVQVMAKDNQMATINSDIVTSNQFFKVEAPNANQATLGSTSIKFTIANPIQIPNKTATYKMEVYTYNAESVETPTIPKFTYKTTKDVTLDENNQITVDGLDPTTQYGFRLVATVDGSEVKSGFSGVITTLPAFNSVTIGTLDDAKKEGSNKVAVEGSTIWISGVPYDTTTIDALQAEKDVIAGLKAGDVVTMNDEVTNVTIVLAGRASGTDDIRTFGTSLANATVDITNNDFDKTLTGTFKSLTLRGNSETAGFNVDGVSSTSPIVLNNGAEVTSSANKNYKVVAGATANINGLIVTTTQDVTLTADANKNLVVDANTTANDLTFENSTEGSATIEFRGAADNTSEQRGTITIKTTGGSVKVSSYKPTSPDEAVGGVNISAEMKVEVTNGTVDIQDPSLTGNKTVTVSVDNDEEKEIDSTVIALAKTKAPAQFNKTVLKDYEDQEIKDMFGVEKEDDIKAIRDYINSFGLNGTGATLTVDKNSDKVTIVLPEGTQNAIIGNLK